MKETPQSKQLNQSDTQPASVRAKSRFAASSRASFADYVSALAQTPMGDVRGSCSCFPRASSIGVCTEGDAMMAQKHDLARATIVDANDAQLPDQTLESLGNLAAGTIKYTINSFDLRNGAGTVYEIRYFRPRSKKGTMVETRLVRAGASPEEHRHVRDGLEARVASLRQLYDAG